MTFTPESSNLGIRPFQPEVPAWHVAGVLSSASVPGRCLACSGTSPADVPRPITSFKSGDAVARLLSGVGRSGIETEISLITLPVADMLQHPPDLLGRSNGDRELLVKLG